MVSASVLSTPLSQRQSQNWLFYPFIKIRCWTYHIRWPTTTAWSLFFFWYLSRFLCFLFVAVSLYMIFPLHCPSNLHRVASMQTHYHLYYLILNLHVLFIFCWSYKFVFLFLLLLPFILLFIGILIIQFPLSQFPDIARPILCTVLDSDFMIDYRWKVYFTGPVDWVSVRALSSSQKTRKARVVLSS